MIKFIDGNICSSEAKYIAHQVNLITSKAAGLAKQIFDNFPYSNIYSQRNSNYYPDKNKLGNIDIRGDGLNNRFVINMFAQYFPGKPQYSDSKLDGYKAREFYFKQCLANISKIDNINSIAFPINIGCGLAGGNWNNYLNLIKEFDCQTSKRQDLNTFILSFKP